MAFRAALSRASAPLIRGRSTAVASTSASLRCLSTSAIRRADDHGHPPIIQGEGAAVGQTPTNFQQATGIERLELLGRLEGIDIFDMKPLDASRIGTMKEPIFVKSLHHERIVGCSGSPAGSHDTIYLSLNLRLKRHRCPECGSVYTLDYIGKPLGGGHH